MQAFKAANKDCSLEDFVRWHSPRDWIEENSDENSSNPNKVKGKLSARMEQEGNLWKQMWEEASPIPASEQKPLFDETTQAEKVRNFIQIL